MCAGMEVRVTARRSVSVRQSSQVRSARFVYVTTEIAWAAPVTVVRAIQVSISRYYSVLVARLEIKILNRLKLLRNCR